MSILSDLQYSKYKDIEGQLSNIYHKSLQLLDRECTFSTTCGTGVEFCNDEGNRIRTNKAVENASCLAFSGKKF